VSHFSSAIVAGKLMKLDAAQLVAAQGIAASTAAGVQVFLEEGAWTKRMHPGWGALAGMTAAHLAAHGFAGPSRPYEGRFGLFESHLQQHAGEVDVPSIGATLGDEWTMMGTAIKPYPVCHFIHGCAEAALRLHDANLNVDDIDEIVCLLPAPTMPIVAEPAAAKRVPKNDYEAKFSTPFVVAACLARGRFGLAELEDEALRDAVILKLASKVRCAADPGADFPRYFSGYVTLTMRDGTQRSEHVPVNLGSGERALGEDEIAQKFRGTAGLVLSRDKVETLLDVLMSPGTRKVRAIARMLRGA
jgi:2-methylcitrate dehydratase PrpD